MNQSTQGFCPLLTGARRLVDVERLPMDVLRPAQRKMQQSGADRGVA